MKKLVLSMLLVLSCCLAACTEKGKQEFETGQLEEQQHNLAHAKQIYEEIIKKYPGTEYAKKSAERLQDMKDNKP